MMSFDLSPLIRGGYKKFIIGPALGAAPLILLAYFLGYNDFAVSLFRGVVIGLLDVVIMLTGIRKAMPYTDEPEKGLKIMKRYRMYRIISASSIVVLLLKQGSSVAGACLGLLLIHILLIFNLTIIAYRLNQSGKREERRV